MNMETFIVNVSKTPKGYCAAMDALPGWVVAVTGSFEKLKKEIAESITFYVDCAKKDNEPYPGALDGKDSLRYRFDVESLLSAYDGIISRAAIAQMSGIDERRLTYYSCGQLRPRPVQRERIVSGIHKIGRELLEVE
jgi:predicted RNase H-like HicB family nuclease